MHLLIIIAIVLCGDYVSAQVRPTRECCPSVEDGDCQADHFTRALAYESIDRGIKGFPEYNVSSVDPTYVKSITQKIMDIFNLTITEGECLGVLTNCTLINLKMDMDNHRRILDFNCTQMTIQGKYVLSTNPAFTKVMGNVSGRGNGSIVIDDWTFSFDDRFSFVKRNNTIYMKLDDQRFKTSINKKITFKADQIKVNNKDMTKQILRHMNEDWKNVAATFGGFMFGMSRDIYQQAWNNIINRSPASEIFCGNLEPYVTNDCSL